ELAGTVGVLGALGALVVEAVDALAAVAPDDRAATEEGRDVFGPDAAAGGEGGAQVLDRERDRGDVPAVDVVEPGGGRFAEVERASDELGADRGQPTEAFVDAVLVEDDVVAAG